MNKTFQLRIKAIRSIDDYDLENVEAIIKEKKALLRNYKNIHESEKLFCKLDRREWLQRQ